MATKQGSSDREKSTQGTGAEDSEAKLLADCYRVSVRGVSGCGIRLLADCHPHQFRHGSDFRTNRCTDHRRGPWRGLLCIRPAGHSDGDSVGAGKRRTRPSQQQRESHRRARPLPRRTFRGTQLIFLRIVHPVRGGCGHVRHSCAEHRHIHSGDRGTAGYCGIPPCS